MLTKFGKFWKTLFFLCALIQFFHLDIQIFKMSEINKIYLNSSCILNVPLQTYSNDFSFIVNGAEFKTSRLISDLISPLICKIHSNDPTVNTFIINTSHQGDFSQILKIFNFQQNSISSNEIPFILEVIEILENESIKLQEQNENMKVTDENVLNLIKQHEKYSKFYKKPLSSEIDFTSSHFYSLAETRLDEFKGISIESLIRIIFNEKLQLNSEDQLLNFINHLYKSDSKYSILYEAVLFENVTKERMKEFTQIYKCKYMTNGTWNRLLKRLELEVVNEKKDDIQNNRIHIGKDFSSSDENAFNGILKYLKIQSNEQIQNEINITASSIWEGDYNPINVTQFDNNKTFCSKAELDNWLCFDFKERKIIPTEYTIMSAGSSYPKSWVIECRNDNDPWEIVDEIKNCDLLNRSDAVHTFKINNQTSKKFQYFRIRQMGPTWQNFKYLYIRSFEIYGRLI